MPDNELANNSEEASPEGSMESSAKGEPDDSFEMLIPPEFVEELRKLPPKAQTTVRAIIEHHSGPLPHPRHLAAYNETLPGAADRIIAMAEARAAHNRETETKIVDAEIADNSASRCERKRGQDYGLAIGLFTVAAGVLTAWLGHPITGGVIGTSGLAGLVSVFVIGRTTSKREDEDTE